MNHVYLGLNWTFGVLILLIALISLSEGIAPTIPLFAIALLLLPPIRKFVHARSNISIPFKGRAIAVSVLVVIFVVLVGQAQDRKKAAIEAQVEVEKAEKIALQKQADIDHFKTNRAEILSAARAASLAGDHQKAISLTSKYLGANDAELSSINAKAKTILAEITKATQEKERLAAERKKKIEAQFSAWDGSHHTLERRIKASMNDPDSYKHAETRYLDRGDHLIVITEFRGKNAFGGMVKNTLRAKVSLDGDIISVLD